jgi:23S rRNA (uracil1939-C5)-methyltransferase
MNKPGKKLRTSEVLIEKLVFGGSGFARHEGKVVFVPFSAPGDRLVVRQVEEKKSFIRAEIVRILKHGNGRTTPVCAHFRKCGGCHWQHLEYSSQLEAKRQILEEAIYHRFPQARGLPIRMESCPQPFAYRSRARVQLRGAGEKALVGFFRPGSHTVEDVESCPLFRESLNEALGSVRQFKLKVDHDSKPQEMDIACSEEEGSWATARCGAPSADMGITTLLGRRRGEDVVLRRSVGAFTYSVTASAFFQANDFMVAKLAALVQDLAKPLAGGSALDLFAGVGLFSLPLARQFAEVIAVENSALATRLCIQNARAAGFGNLQAECADVAAWIEMQERSAAGAYDLVVLDPPRTGAGPDVMKRISGMAPKRILYVSCDPQTLIRDLAAISPQDYAIRFVEGLDMFPQTYHFETVVLLDKN